MTMTTYGATQLAAANKLITYPTMMQNLSARENLERVLVTTDGTDKIKFDFADDFAVKFDERPGDDLLPGAAMSVGDAEYQLTKNAFIRALQQVGLRPTFGKKTPGEMLARVVEHHFTHAGTDSDMITILTQDSQVVEMVPDNRQVFSTYQVVETVAAAAAKQFGMDVDKLYFDYKYQDDLSRSALRLIVPDTHRTIKSRRHGNDVEDIWSTGIAVHNSMVGAVSDPLSVMGYLFAWWCTNGATTSKAHSETYSKRSIGADWDAVKGWLADSTVSTLELLPETLDRVEDLTQLDLSGEMGSTATDMIRAFDLPISATDRVRDYLVENDDFSGYGLMNAITQAANDSDLSDTKRTRILDAGGAVSHALIERCDACHRITA